MPKIKIHAVVNAPKSQCAGEYGDALKIKVAAPAIDGKANEELVRFIAKKIGLPRCGVRIVSGQTSRDKIVEVDAEDARARLLM